MLNQFFYLTVRHKQDWHEGKSYKKEGKTPLMNRLHVKAVATLGASKYMMVPVCTFISVKIAMHNGLTRYIIYER